MARERKVTKTRSRHVATVMGGPPVGREVPTRVRPFPEIIDETDWEVKEGRYPSYIKRSRKADAPHVMQVPLGGTPIDRKIRLHEQAHVNWTKWSDGSDVEEDDERLMWVEMDTVNATEDARIIELMARTSDEWGELNRKQVGLLTPQMEKAFADGFSKLAEHLKGVEEKKPKAGSREKIMSLVEAARLIASTRGYAEGDIFDQLAKNSGLDWVTKDVEKMHKNYISNQEDPTFEHSVAYAEWLEAYFQQKQAEIEEMNEALRESGMRMGAGTESKPEVYTPPVRERTEGKVQPREPRRPERDGSRGTRWGQLTIVNKKLTEKLAARHARRPRPTDAGAVPRYMYRLMSDQRIFGRRRKKKAYEGSLLIDCSGSMSLSPEEVDEMLRRWPAATIGTYCGSGGMGELWVVAKNGKRAPRHELHPQLGGNVVDGPALDWLAKQKMPRIWISDGGVSGIGDSFGNAFVADAAVKMKRGKIKRLANVHELLGGNYGDEYYDDDVGY